MDSNTEQIILEEAARARPPAIERHSRHNWTVEQLQDSALAAGGPIRHNLKPGRAHRLHIERPVRTRKGNVVWIHMRELMPEWWPCLCNGGWDPCPICQCGLKEDPPCYYCAPSPIEPTDPGYAAVEALAIEEEARQEAQLKEILERRRADPLHIEKGDAIAMLVIDTDPLIMRPGDTGPLWTPEEEEQWLREVSSIEDLEEPEELEADSFYWQQLLDAPDGEEWEYYRDRCQDTWEGRRAA